MPQRSEEDVLRGVLRASVGGKPREVRELAIDDAEKWIARCWEVLSGDVGGMSLEDLSDLAPAATTAVSKVVDLVVEYDKDGTLGGAEYLRKNATPGEIYAFFREAAKAALPFVEDLLGLVREIRATGLLSLAASGGSPQARSTNGRSESTDSVLATSAPT